jgi:hypothetical protein
MAASSIANSCNLRAVAAAGAVRGAELSARLAETGGSDTTRFSHRMMLTSRHVRWLPGAPRRVADSRHTFLA